MMAPSAKFKNAFAGPILVVLGLLAGVPLFGQISPINAVPAGGVFSVGASGIRYSYIDMPVSASGLPSAVPFGVLPYVSINISPSPTLGPYTVSYNVPDEEDNGYTTYSYIFTPNLNAVKLTEGGWVLATYDRKVGTIPCAYAWHNGQLTPLNQNPSWGVNVSGFGNETTAYDINDSGTVVGDAIMTVNTDPQYLALEGGNPTMSYVIPAFWFANQSDAIQMGLPSGYLVLPTAYVVGNEQLVSDGGGVGGLSLIADSGNAFNDLKTPTAMDYYRGTYPIEGSSFVIKWNTTLTTAATVEPTESLPYPSTINARLQAISPDGLHLLYTETNLSSPPLNKYQLDGQDMTEVPGQGGTFAAINNNSRVLFGSGWADGITAVQSIAGLQATTSSQSNGTALAINGNNEVLGRKPDGSYALYTWTPRSQALPNGLYSENPITFTLPAGWRVNSVSSSLNNSRMFVGQIAQAVDLMGNAIPSPSQVGQAALFAPAAMLVDANSDMVIDANDVGANSASNPFHYWINNDNDNGAFSIPDCTTGVVNGQNDLKDFFPLVLMIQNVVKVLPPGEYSYILKQEDSALAFGYTNLTTSNPYGYRTSTDSSGFGSNLSQSAATANVTQITPSGVSLDPAFLSQITAQGGVLMVEGCAPSIKPLVLSVQKNGVEVAQLSLQLSLGSRIVLLLHGMESNPGTWDALVGSQFALSGIIQDRAFVPGLPPQLSPGGVRCYRLQFGFYDMASTRTGLEGLTALNAPGYLDGQNVGYMNSKIRCGDFETFDQLGQEVDDAISLLLDPVAHPENKYAQIVLLGHSRGGLSARAFLEGSSVNRSSVIGLLTTSSPHLGSRMGRIYDWLTLHPRHEFGPSGQELTMSAPGSAPGDDQVPVNQQDWDTVDFLASPTVLIGGLINHDKDVLDVRRPVIMDMADSSSAVANLNDPGNVAALPSNVVYGEIVYYKAPFGLLVYDTANYSVFGRGLADWIGGKFLSWNAEQYITNGTDLTDQSVIGDGLIPGQNQVFTQLGGFPQPPAGVSSNKIPRVINTTNLVVHTGAPNQIPDIKAQLIKLTPAGWIK